MNIAEIRHEFDREALERHDLADSPFEQFGRWLKEAFQEEHEPNALSLATSQTDHSLSLRTVLLKSFDERGFSFFTNYGSRKAQQITTTHKGVMLFPWLKMERQVEISGSIEKVSREESEAYFRTRPRGSQIGAWASPQSLVIKERSELDAMMHQKEEQFPAEVPLPDSWGGYRLVPERFEFWQGRPNRLHDRFQYTKTTEGVWMIERLAP